MASTAVTAIVDKTLSREAAVLAEIGMTVDEALQLLLRQVASTQTLSRLFD
jgi:antitoxin component of RelBE/YafQ-DinJ toxin-antitoxin module